MPTFKQNPIDGSRVTSDWDTVDLSGHAQLDLRHPRQGVSGNLKDITCTRWGSENESGPRQTHSRTFISNDEGVTFDPQQEVTTTSKLTCISILKRELSRPVSETGQYGEKIQMEQGGQVAEFSFQDPTR